MKALDDAINLVSQQIDQQIADTCEYHNSIAIWPFTSGFDKEELEMIAELREYRKELWAVRDTLAES